MSKFGHLVWFILTIGAVAVGFWGAKSGFVELGAEGDSKPEEPEILYWVAPMDDNYRRDKPGKSPMGMDLVPVYAEKETKKKEPEILYWVAPMDDNYRRDKPGKSPMGMDLVPVYANDDAGEEGVINISPQVVNSIGVRSEEVYVGPLNDEVEAVGTISVDQSQLFHVYPRVEGWVEQLYVAAVGDYVNKDQPLFSFYSPTLVHEQEEYLTILRRSKVVAGQSEALVKGAETRLLALGVSKRQINEIGASGKVAEYVTIYARAPGYVTFLHLREGQYIKPSDKLLTVADTSSVWVMVELFERYANDVALGQMGSLTVEALGSRVWQAQVKHIHPFLIADTRTLRLRLQVNNDDDLLKPNMFAKIRLERNIAQEVIAVPTQALIRTGQQNRVVLALGDGQFRSIAVAVGREVEGLVEITKGLAKGDKVVTSAHFLLDSESSTSADFSRMEVIERNDKMDHSMMNHGDMDHSMMNHGDMDHSKMNHGDMDHSKMDHGDMDHSKMNHGDMDHSKMNHGDMDHSKMNHGDMDHSKMDHGEMDHSKMDHGDMDHSKMNHGDMDHSKMNHGDMDHSKMNHGEMDHSKMDHGDMDHSKMNHGEMDHSKMDHSKHTKDDGSHHGGHH